MITSTNSMMMGLMNTGKSANIDNIDYVVNCEAFVFKDN